MIFLPWVLGGVATLLVLGTSNRASAAPVTAGGTGDLDALADMLIAETAFARSQDEMAQIVWVAVNRARRYGKSLYDIVSPASRSPAWNTGSTYRTRYDAARDNPRWDSARAFASSVMRGSYKNLGATAFVHPAAMPVPPCSENRVATATSAGTRCLPSWIVGGTPVGGALFA